MSYYPTLTEDVERAKAILKKGGPCQYRPDHNGECLDCDEPAEVHQLMGASGSGTIYGADVYAAYKLLESFVEALEAVGPKVAELALRHEQRTKTPEWREVPELYDVARETNHASGFPWTDPRTGVTYPPPKKKP